MSGPATARELVRSFNFLKPMHSVEGSSPQSQPVKPGGGAFIIYIWFMVAVTSLTGDPGSVKYCIIFFFIHNKQKKKTSLSLTGLISQNNCGSVHKLFVYINKKKILAHLIKSSVVQAFWGIIE